ncbi:MULTISPECIES: BTAD domain-containing putative transcriptional regulator [unclassified Streptomyces]|uniref:AfsR/SARP family transcriptional regulator n=1 Tax=unclassified Streptomyces TaxID=2593676 RepID=UPI00340D0B84
MEFSILGPVEASVGGTDIPLDGTKQRTTLAALLLAHGHMVTDDRLSALLWGWEPPATMSAQIYTYISRLRKRLGPGIRLERRGPGYWLDIGRSGFDWAEFERLAGTGTRALTDGRFEQAARDLRDALALWSAPALSNTTDYLGEIELPRLEEAYMAALESRIEADLAMGSHTALVAELTPLVARHPLRERLRAQLMTALYRSDRQAEALAVYRAGRHTLREELGIDPGRSLRTVHDAILTGELTGPAAATAVLSSSSRSWNGLVPAMLPPDVTDFHGREEQLAEVTALLRPHTAGPHRAVITGMPGIGKSALAVHAAQLNRDHFPDAQLYVDLRDAQGRPKNPYEVLGWFLHALGTAEADLPASLDERSQLYRSRLAGLRALVVLDNAQDDRQTRPLLPGGRLCRTIITGRSPLGGLEGIRLVHLGLPEQGEAIGLLSRLVGATRVSAEPEAALRIVELCDRLPLALRVAATRLAANPRWPLSRLLGRLVREEHRLNELRLGGLDLRASLRPGYDALDETSRQAFHGLALGCSAELNAREASGVLGLCEERAEELLEALADARLIEVSGVGTDERLHYRFLSLVRLFAQEQGHVSPSRVPPRRSRDLRRPSCP